MNSNVNLPRRSTLTPSFPARLKLGRTARILNAVSGPKTVYWGKPRRGIMLEKDRHDVDDCVGTGDGHDTM